MKKSLFWMVIENPVFKNLKYKIVDNIRHWNVMNVKMDIFYKMIIISKDLDIFQNMIRVLY